MCQNTFNGWAVAQKEEAVSFSAVWWNQKKKKEDRRLFPFEIEDQSLKMLQLLISSLNPEILLTLVGVLRA